MTKYFVLIILTMLLAGCAPESRVTSIKANIHSQYSCLLIRAHFDNVQLESDYESALYYAFGEKGIVSIRDIDAFPPFRSYTDSEISAFIAEKGIDGILILTPNGVTTGSTTRYNDWTGSYDTHQTIDNVYSEISLKDVKSKQQVYLASVSTSLRELNSSEGALESAARGIAKDLWNSEYLTSTSRPRIHWSADPNDH